MTPGFGPLRSPSTSDPSGGDPSPAASTQVAERAETFTKKLDGKAAVAIQEAATLITHSSEHRQKLIALIGASQDVASEAVRIIRGALQNNPGSVPHISATIDCFHRYVFELGGNVSAHSTCMDNLKGEREFPDPLTIFGSASFQVDTPTRRELASRSDFATRIVSESDNSMSSPRVADVERQKVIGDSSAQAMTGPIYHLFFRDNARIPGHLCGWQSASKLLEAYNHELRQKILNAIDERTHAIEATLQALGLTDNTDLRPEVASRISTRTTNENSDISVESGKLSKTLKERRALLEAVQAEVNENLDILDMLRYSETELTPQGRTFHVASQSRGHLMTWLDRELATEQQRKDAPEWVVEDYDTLRNGGVRKLPIDEVELRVTRLAAYRARRTFVRKEAVFSSLQSDLEYFSGLEAQTKTQINCPQSVRALVSDFGSAASLIRYVRTFSSEGNAEIPKESVPKVKEACAGLYRFRERVCREFLQPFKAEFETALEAFRPLFQTAPHQWHDDCRSPSVPLERLRGTAAGTVLLQRDFAALKEAFELLACTSAENEHSMFRSKSILDFMAMTRGVVVAYRKWDFFRAHCARSGAEPINAYDAVEAVKGMELPFLRSNLQTEEEFAESHDGLTPAELITRAEWLSKEQRGATRDLDHIADSMQEIERATREAKPLAQIRLYRATNATFNPLAVLFQAGKSLVPASQVEAEIKIYLSLRDNPLVVSLPGLPLGQPYYTQKQVLVARTLASIANPALQAADEFNRITTPEQRAALKPILQALLSGRVDESQPHLPRFALMTFVNGSFMPRNDARRALLLHDYGDFYSYAQNTGRAVLTKSAPLASDELNAAQGDKPQLEIRYFDPQKLINGIGILVHDYVRVDNVWAQRALLVCESKQREFLSQAGLAVADTPTWTMLKRRRINSPASDNSFDPYRRWVSRSLVEEVEAAYARLEPLLPEKERAEERKEASLHGRTVASCAGMPDTEAQRIFPYPKLDV